MRILGIDPGYGRMGYGLIEKVGMNLVTIEFGTVTTDSSDRMEVRLARIYERVKELIDRFAPDCIASERQIFSSNKTTGLDVSKALGVVMLACAHCDLPWVDYTPAEVKQAVTGSGSADKKQVQFMVARLLSLQGSALGDDASDALAIAICHAQRERIGSLG
jgi:crossover junction endodeoxyribonuclease RuvC